MDISNKIAEELAVKDWQVKAAIELIDEGNTIPFIARYRKPQTGELNDEQLRKLDQRLTYLRNLEDKKKTVIDTITEQGKMSDELLKAIEDATTLVEVEDIYRPYKPKRKTRATVAIDKGLKPLADIIMEQDPKRDIKEDAARYVNPEKDVETIEDAISGAKDIIAEEISDNASFRSSIRRVAGQKGFVEVKEKEDKDGTYDVYHDYSEPVSKIPGHRILAINRGEREKALTRKIEFPDDVITGALKKTIIKNDSSYKDAISEAIDDAYKRLIKPSIEREIISDLTDKAEDGSIEVYKKNLRQLLMQPPIAGRVVLGWDPAFRTGCKLAVADETGKILYTKVIFPTAPQNKVEESIEEVLKIVKKYGVSLIALGNGTASRESEAVVCDIIKRCDSELSYVIVNEAGASVYSASELASKEFPNFDVGQRSSASMARRLQDPLSELVKIDPKSLGVGQYQHDMNQKKLSSALESIVEDCVNEVGVDLNTASVPLLTYVSGISNTLAINIVEYRDENGAFKSRSELKKVSKLGPKAFEQCAGFMRIRDGKEPLDYTSIHPESYSIAKEIIKRYGYKSEDILSGGVHVTLSKDEISKLADELKTDKIVIRDIISMLDKPARDPRDKMPAPILKSDVLDIKDLKEGMILKGTVRNVIDFGAFVDIGVHQDGLVHISKMSNSYVKHPLDVVSVGDIVDVSVIGVDLKRNRIQLSMVF